MFLTDSLQSSDDPADRYFHIAAAALVENAPMPGAIIEKEKEHADMRLSSDGSGSQAAFA